MAASISWESARDLLRMWREENVRNSEEVLEKWERSLCNYVHKLGDEMWLAYEQVCIAAFDCNRLDIAQECLDVLEKQFPGSLRVRKLKAMSFEASEKFEDALKMYDQIISNDESNAIARKRKIAILKSMNKIPEAIKELNDYLKKFMSDQEAWMELSDLYIQEQDYSKAAFCLEELILFNPHNHLYHQRYAEIRYTQGGFENMELARAYFAQAVKLNSNNIRALFGLFLAASNIASSPKCPAQKKKENVKYANWAKSQISEKYQDDQQQDEDSQLKLLEGMLTSLQIVPAN